MWKSQQGSQLSSKTRAFLFFCFVLIEFMPSAMHESELDQYNLND